MRGDGRRGLRGWLIRPGSGTGSWGFVANRVSALILVGYLYLHLMVLSLLVRGSSSWDSFLSIAGTRAFVAVDLVLFLAVVWHAANGVRVGLVGTGDVCLGDPTLDRVHVHETRHRVLLRPSRDGGVGGSGGSRRRPRRVTVRLTAIRPGRRPPSCARASAPPAVP